MTAKTAEQRAEEFVKRWGAENAKRVFYTTCEGERNVDHKIEDDDYFLPGILRELYLAGYEQGKKDVLEPIKEKIRSGYIDGSRWLGKR